MAFADNLVFLTEERIHMQIMLEEWNEFFDNKGLTANNGKCASLGVVPVPKKRTIKVILKEDPHRRAEIRRNRYKVWNRYLGKKAHLNPIQKIEVIRRDNSKNAVSASIERPRIGGSEKDHRLILKSVKRILHLPS